jgi:preprotein translocase subunit SecD
MHIAIVSAAALSLAGQASLPRSSEAGVQIASVQLCRDAVVRADWENSNEGPTLRLQFSKTAADAIQRRSRELVGKTLRVTLNGQLLREIYVIEPLTASSVQLPLKMNEAGELLSAISRTSCPQ